MLVFNHLSLFNCSANCSYHVEVVILNVQVHIRVHSGKVSVFQLFVKQFILFLMWIRKMKNSCAFFKFLTCNLLCATFETGICQRLGVSLHVFSGQARLPLNLAYSRPLDRVSKKRISFWLYKEFWDDLPFCKNKYQTNYLLIYLNLFTCLFTHFYRWQYRNPTKDYSRIWKRDFDIEAWVEY